MTDHTDLIQRLRNWRESGEPPRATQDLCDEAANALEALPASARAGDGIPAGWSITRDEETGPGCIRVFSPCPGPGGTVLVPPGGSLAYRLLYALCDDLLAAAPAVSAPAWQPIETAPKDGSTVLLWESGSSAPFVGAWRDGRRPGWHCDTEHYNTDGNACVISNLWQEGVTHWMPLPAAPGFQGPVTAPVASDEDDDDEFVQMLMDRDMGDS